MAEFIAATGWYAETGPGWEDQRCPVIAFVFTDPRVMGLVVSQNGLPAVWDGLPDGWKLLYDA